jgi:hypothetical protein
MRRLLSMATLAGLSLALAGCGSNRVDRTATGAGVGALAGAGAGALLGPIGVVTGALVGAGAGAGVGIATNSNQIDLGKPVYR